MPRLGFPDTGGDQGRWGRWRRRAVHAVPVCMEAVVLVLFCGSPWVYGAVHPLPELMLYAGVGVLLALWGARMLLEWQVTYRNCPATLCLAALFLAGVCQVVPLPTRLLSSLSPATVKLCRQLLPAQPEVLPFGESRAAATHPAGNVMSLYPGATRRELLRLLAVFLLFAVVRNNLSSTAGLRRLSVAAVANGAALALFALVQFFTAPQHTVYWSAETGSTVFGPFFCRNHYPYYVNMCVALGMGLLLSLRAPAGEAGPPLDGGSPRRPAAGVLGSRRGPFSALAVLHRPGALWLISGLSLMVSSVVFCLSRGGLIALVGGGLTCALVGVSRAARFSRLALPGVVVLVAAGLLTWFGLDRLQARYRPLWTGDTAWDDRSPIWSRTLPLVKDFPVWGTGWGTFRHVEPLRRPPGENPDLDYDHAHNDYVEALIEGGLVWLVLGLLAVVFVLRHGYLVFRHGHGRPVSGLALGGLFAFVTVLLHSFFDFGLHVPAIAFAATVVGAHLTGLHGARGAGGGGTTRRERRRSGSFRLRLGGLAPLAGAVLVLLTAGALYGEGRRLERADWWRRAAAQCHSATGAGARRQELTCLQAAVGFRPDDAALQVALAETYVTRFQELTLRPAPAGPPTDAEQERRVRDYLVPGLRHYLLARDLCPLLAGPHLGIAAHLAGLEKAEARRAYLQRAKILLPFEPALWYGCGVLELQDDNPEQAWKSWRQSLACSDRFLGEIVTRSANRLGPQDLLDKVLPASPGLLWQAASLRCPGLESADQRRPLLNKALALLEGQGGPPAAEDLHTKALVCQELGQPEQAVAAFRAAIARDPDKVEWRCELARWLHQQGQVEESRREAVVILARQPGNAEARKILANHDP